MADTTAKAECAQALFCAMADYIGATEVEKIFKGPDAYVDAVNKAGTKTGRKRLETFEEFENRVLPLRNDYINTGQDLVELAWSDRIMSKTLPDVNLRVLREFLKDEKWHLSSRTIAITLIKDIADKLDADLKSKFVPEGFDEIFYFRGDKDVMGNLEKIFKIANKNEDKPFGDVNKWSPADIYFSTNAGKAAIKNEVTVAEKKQSYIFDAHFNPLIIKLIDSGDLLPLSLKKAGDTAALYKINYVRSQEEKILAEIKRDPKASGRFGDTVDSWQPITKREQIGAKGFARDLQIGCVAEGSGGQIKLRHDASGASWKTEFIGGALARGGSIGSHNIMQKVWANVSPQRAQKFFNAFVRGNEKFKQAQKDTKYVVGALPPWDKWSEEQNKWLPQTELLPIGEYNAPGDKKPNAKLTLTSVKSKLDQKQKKWYDDERGWLSAIHVTNVIQPIIIEQVNDEADDFIKFTYEYMTSRTRRSARFIIAK
tara:strand:- start:7192 stop:8643 length:1452 start_codon:yes stop_codon:yes gene_type:complete